MRGIAFPVDYFIRIEQSYLLFGHTQQQAFIKVTHDLKALVPTKRKLGLQSQIPPGKAAGCRQKTPRADFSDQTRTNQNNASRAIRIPIA